MNIRYGFWNRATRPARRKPQARRFSLESLESRRLLATVNVNGATGNDATGDGSAANPFKTITKGISVAVSDVDVVSIAAGAYAEAVNVNKNLGITAVGAVNATSWTSQPANTATWSGTFAATTDFLFSGPALIAATTQFTGANVQFLGTLNSALAASPQPLTVNATAVARFGDAAADTVGVTAALASLSITDGTTTIAAGTVVTTGDQIYNDDVRLAFTTALSAANVRFNANLDSADNVTARSLTVNATGVAAFGDAAADAVGVTFPIAALTLGAGVSTNLNAGQFRTNDSLTFNNPVLVTGNVVAQVTAANNVTFNNTVNRGAAPGSLTVNAGGETRFAGAVGGPFGGANALARLETNAAGTTVIATPVVNTTSDQIFNDNVFLAVTTELRAANVQFNGNLNSLDNVSARSLTVAASAACTFGDAVTDTVGVTFPIAGITLGPGVRTNINVGQLRTNDSLVFDNPVFLTGNVLVAVTAANNVSFNNTVDSGAAPGSLTVTAGGNTRFGGLVGVANALARLETNGAGLTIFANPRVITSGDQIYTEDVRVAANVELRGANIRFDGNIDSLDATPRSLTVNATVAATFGSDQSDRIGNAFPLSALESGNGGTTQINAASVRTNGSTIVFSDPVILTTDLTIVEAGPGNVSFLSTIDSFDDANPRLLRVETTGGGDTIFNDVIGGDHPLRVLQTDQFGKTLIGAVQIFTNGASITFEDPVILTDDLTINEAGPGDVSFLDTVDSDNVAPHFLRVETPGGGDTIFRRAIGLGEELLFLRTVAPGTTFIRSTDVVTVGDQDYEDDVVLDGPATNFRGEDIRFLDTLDSNVAPATAVLIDTTPAGLTRFVGPVGATVGRLGSLRTDPDGSTSVEGGFVFTVGEQRFEDPVTVGATTVFDSDAAGVAFESALDAAAANFDITVNAPGVTLFGGNVGLGNATPPRDLTTDEFGTTTIDAAQVRTSRDQLYRDPVTLTAAATTFTANNFTFEKTLDSTNDTNAIFNSTLAGLAGLTRFAGAVGSNSPLGRLETNLPGTTRIDGGAVTTAVEQLYRDPVTITQSTIFSGDDLAPPTPGDVRFNNTLDAIAAGRDVTVDATGVTRFGGAVGNSGRPQNLSTNAGGVTLVDGGVVQTIDNQTYGDAVIVGVTTLFDSDNASVLFGNTLDAAAAGLDINVNAPAVTRFGGDVGFANATPPQNLTTDADGSTVFGAVRIRTQLDQTYNDRVVLEGDAMTLSLNRDIFFRQTVDAAGSGNGTALFGLLVDRQNGTSDVIFDQAVGSGASGTDPDGVEFLRVLANGPLRLIADITAADLIRVQIIEGAAASVTDDLTVISPVRLFSLQDIALLVADDITLATGSSVIANGGTLEISGDFGDNDAAGTTINILGATALVGAGAQVRINGGPDDDFLNLQFARFRATDNILVDGAGNSGATFTLVTDGISAPNVCDATMDTDAPINVPVGDSLNLFDTGQAGNQVYNLNSVRLARAGGPTFQFLEIQQLDLFAGTGIDQLIAVMPSLPSVVRFDGGGLPGVADQLDIIGSAGDDLISVAPIGLAPDRPFQIANVRALRVQAGAGNDTVVNNTDFATSLLQGQAGEDNLVGGELADVIYGGPDADHILGLGGNDFLFPDHDFNGTNNGILTIADGDISDGGAPIALPGDAAVALDGTNVAVDDLDLVCNIERLADGGARKNAISWLNAQIAPVGNPVNNPVIQFLINESSMLLASVPVNTLPPLLLAADPVVIDNPDFDHWLDNLYQALLGRDFAPAERQYYVNIHAAGASRDDIVQGFINSPERRGNIIAGWYDRYLNRALDAGGRSHWLGVWAQSGAEAVEAGILSSGEFFQFVGGTNSAWVDAMYAQVLGRTAGASEKQFWLDKANLSQRQLLSQQFVSSDEHRLLGIASWYRIYLGRNPETGGAQYWLQKQKSGFKPEKIQSSILTSLEFQKMVW